jgi:formyl-CoA transferase
VLETLAAAQVPASKIFSAADMFRDAQYLARGMIEPWQLPDGTALNLPGIVPKLSATPGCTEWVGPRLGEHTDEILAAVGYSSAAIAALRHQGAI